MPLITNPHRMEPDGADQNLVDRQAMALDALSKLSRQFASQPNFSRLVDTLVLTISGQFSVTNAFASFHRPGKELCQRPGRVHPVHGLPGALTAQPGQVQERLFPGQGAALRPWTA